MTTPEATTSQTYRFARAWHAAVAVIVLASLVAQFVLSLTGVGTIEPDVAAGTRVIRFFSFFTIMSNILFCAVSITLAIKPDRREGLVWRVLRLDAVLCMAVTGLVFVTVLRGLEDLSGLRVFTDAGLHYVAPPLAVLGWLLFGPRPRITQRVVYLATVLPIAWAAYTLLRGAVVDWYPYPFIDVIEHGYGQVLVNIVVVATLFVAFGLLFWYLDRRLAASPGRASSAAGE